MALTTGRSSLPGPGPPVPSVPVPSSAMVVETEPVAMVALVGALRLTEYASEPSKTGCRW